jgi:hypothetical protein
MSKNRLDESTIRRFMGLAGLQPIGEGFLDRVREEDGEEDALAPEEELPTADAAPMDAPLDDAGPEAPEAAPIAAEMAQDVANAVADALTAALAPHGVTVDAGAAGEEAAPEAALDAAPEPDLGPEPDMEGGEEEMALESDAAATDDDEALTRLESADVEIVDDEKVVQEVARRVAKRLLKTSRR